MDFMGFINKNYEKHDLISKMCINSKSEVYTYHYKALNLATQFQSTQTTATNIYISMNPMKFINKKINRDKKHVSKLKWLFVDLDTYKSEFSYLTNKQILGNLELDLFGHELPYPNYVIDSGRGMYLLWRVDEHIKAEPRWVYVQKYLHKKLNQYGADGAVVTDTARVLRAVGSINSKSNTEVKIIENYTDHIYSLYEIMQEYIPNNWNRKSSPKYSKKIIYLNNEYSLSNARLKDLENLLINFRDYPGAYREYILFLYRYYSLCVLDDKSKALEKTLELNGRLKNGLSKKEVISATRSAEKYYDNNGFKITNKTIIKNIKITEFEMKSMKTIISSSEKLLRKCTRNRKAYLNKLILAGKETKEEGINKRLLAEAKLIKEGKKPKEICDILHISKSTFYTDKKKLLSMLSMNSNDIEEICTKQEKVEKYEINENENTENVNLKQEMVDNLLFKRSPKNSALVLRERSSSSSSYLRLRYLNSS